MRDHLGEEEPLLLGVREGVAHFAVDLSSLAAITTMGVRDADFMDARRIAVDLPEGDAGILAQGRALLEWRRRHRHCGTCGAPTRAGGGAVLTCTACGAEHFPSAPGRIMVVWRARPLLLG
ncbi:MAG: NUDIX-like domain-containing protein [Dehalococcoidia bacterium]